MGLRSVCAFICAASSECVHSGPSDGQCHVNCSPPFGPNFNLSLSTVASGGAPAGRDNLRKSFMVGRSRKAHLVFLQYGSPVVADCSAKYG